MEFLKEFGGIWGGVQNADPAGRYPHLEIILNEISKSAATPGETDQAMRKIISEFQKGYLESLSPADRKEFNRKQQEFQTGSLDTGEFLRWMTNTGSKVGFVPELDFALRELAGRPQTLSLI